MSETPEHLAERLTTEGHRTIEFFQSLTLEQWELILYSEGSRWTVRQLLAHFISTEIAFTELIKNILAGGEGAPEGFDIDAFNEQQVLEWQQMPLQELREQFYCAREASIALVRRMQPEDLLKSGRHPFLGMTALEEIIKLLYRHNQIHQRDVRKLLIL